MINIHTFTLESLVSIERLTARLASLQTDNFIKLII